MIGQMAFATALPKFNVLGRPVTPFFQKYILFDIFLSKTEQKSQDCCPRDIESYHLGGCNARETIAVREHFTSKI